MVDIPCSRVGEHSYSGCPDSILPSVGIGRKEYEYIVKRSLELLSALVALVALAIVVARLLFPLPDVSDRITSRARASDPSTSLGQRMDEAMQAHPGKGGVAALKGGRNIGNEYFEVGEDTYFVDLDVLATGAVVPETAAMFDDYWNSASTFEVERVIEGVGDLAAFEARVADVKASAEAAKLKVDLHSSADRHRQGDGALEWTDVQSVADDPIKGPGISTPDELMITRLAEILDGVEKRLDLVSAYFIPGQRGTAFFADLARSGNEVRIQTNAANTTDVLMVHAGYSKYRRELLEAGVELYELKLGAEQSPGCSSGRSACRAPACTQKPS